MMVDAYTVPQDDYFEWENIIDNRPFVYNDNFSFLPDYKAPNDYFSCFRSLEQRASSPGVSFPAYEDFNTDQPENKSGTNKSISVSPLLENTGRDTNKQDSQPVSSPSPKSLVSSRVLFSKAQDDSKLAAQPTQNVDYLAFPWHKCESDLWASRKHLELTRKKNNNQEEQIYDRLRNACWRAVAVGRLKLKKVDPQTFNWHKDQDLTWLHGPFVPQSTLSNTAPRTPTSQSKVFTDVSMKQERRIVKPAVKYVSLRTILLRGSVPPEKNPKKLHSRSSEQKRRQIKALRFSSEISQPTSPINISNEMTAGGSSSNSSVDHVSTKLNFEIASLYARQDTELSSIIATSIMSVSTTKLEQSSFLVCNSKQLIEPSMKTACQAPSSRLRVDLVSEDAAALRRAFQVVADARQRAIPSYPCHNEMPLRTTIIA